MSGSDDDQRVAKRKKKLLLIGWDAADWEHINPLLDQGLLPNLEKFINQGVMGNLATLQPVLSPILWNSAATGKQAFKHGVLGFSEPDKHNGGARPSSSYTRTCKAIWNILSQNDYKCNVVNWWASHPAEKINGCVISNLINGVKFGIDGPIVSEGVVHPAEKSKFYGQFKVHPRELTSEQICAFIPDADKLNQDEDSRLYSFAETLAETLTTHSVATAVMEAEEWDFMAVYYTCIDHFAHGFMPYHPPKLPWISDQDFQIFKDVFKGAYRFSDMMLERLLQFTDEDTTVILCSDHGFHSGQRRPRITPREPAGPTVWHRDLGVFLMKGPNIKKDERIYGANLIDITPTILTALDLPIGQDMDGRPLLDVFIDPPEVQTITSWEDVPGDDGMHTEEVPLSPQEADELMQQMIALGYVDNPAGDKQQQYEDAEIECKYNLGLNYLSACQWDLALQQMEDCARRAPWETRFILHLVHCYQYCGYLRQAIQVIESAFDLSKPRNIFAQTVWCECHIDLGNRSQKILDMLQRVEQQIANRPGFMNRVAKSYVRLRMWSDAQRAYEKAVQMHPSNAEALQGLARIFCKQGLNQETADAALAAVGQVYRLPQSHLYLGIAMARSDNTDRAVQALKTALQFSPDFVSAHRWLAAVYRSQLKDNEMADFHIHKASHYSNLQAQLKKPQKDRREILLDIPEFPDEAERTRILDLRRPIPVDPRKPSGKEFVLVSGLPRSGTSMMMQMLQAGGMDVKTDGQRKADVDNPKGYYEWEEIKQIVSRHSVLDEPGLDSKAIKCVSTLLGNLPYRHSYKILYMVRPIDQLIASQAEMIDRLGTQVVDSTDDEMAGFLEQHRDAAFAWMTWNPRVEFLEVDYPMLVESPEKILPEIAAFLGSQRLPNPDAMLSVIDKSLYRKKTAGSF